EGGSTGALNFTVGDIDNDLTDLTVTAASSNTTVIPNANIVIGGGLGTTRTVTVTPPVNQFGGPVTITLEVSDGNLTATATFTVTINTNNDAPTVTRPGPQTINENTPTGALNFTVDDIDNPIASLTVTGTSSNQTLIPTANIAFGGGTGATRTVTV